MSSSGPGTNTSEVEVTNISAHGLWLLVRGRELFMPYEDFPWFSEQPLKSILKVMQQIFFRVGQLITSWKKQMRKSRSFYILLTMLHISLFNLLKNGLIE